MRRIFQYVANFIASIATRIKISLSKLIYQISKITTGAILLGGALCGLTTINGELQTNRLAIAGFAFIIGLPLGLIIFGNTFTMTVWFAVITSILFISNLHSAWDVLFSLKYGGLDFIMTEQSINSVNGITPTKENWNELNFKLSTVKENISYNTNNKIGFLKENI